MRTTQLSTIKALFQTGDTPTQADFYRLIESLFVPFAVAEVTATADEYVATLEINGTAITIDALSSNELYFIVFDSSNTGPTTLNINSKGLKAVKKHNSAGALVALATNDIVSGTRYLLQYDGTDFIILNPLPTTASAGTTYNRFGTTAGTANTYTLAATGYSAHAQDVAIYFRVNASNTGASTININSLGAVALKKNSITGALVDVEINDLRTNHTYVAIYDGTYYVVLNPLTGAQKYDTIGFAISDLTTAITTGTDKGYMRAPFGGLLVGVKVSLKTAQTSGSIFTVDINKNGTSVLTTKLTVDNTEKTSETAVTPAVIDSSASTFAADDEITADVDQVGDGTAKGCIVYLTFKRP